MIYRGVVTLAFTARFDEVSFPTAPPTTPSFSLRHRVSRLCSVSEVALHFKASRKLAIRWRERLRLDASNSIGCWESRPIFIELLARALFRIETAFQVSTGLFHISGLGCAAAACGYIPAWDTIGQRSPHKTRSRVRKRLQWQSLIVVT